MPDTSQTPFFSVIIATRDRPTLFKRAAESVLAQNEMAKELIVVMDGSQDHYLPDYEQVFEALKAGSDTPIHIHRLMHRAKGHGQSYSFNHGVSCAAGQFVTFLDDDDEWCDTEHLARVRRAIDTADPQGGAVDYVTTNQNAYFGDERKTDPVWLEDLEEKLQALGKEPFAEAFYAVTIEDLFKAYGFCHLNTSIIRRALYEEIGGMDEGIRWECDRDVYLRVIEAARQIVFVPNVISKHYIPDPKDKSSMTTSASMVQKRLFQVQVLNKTIANTRNETILKHAKASLAYAMRKLALELKDNGRKDSADSFSKAAQAFKYSPLWPVEYARAG